eukprot:3913845-Rhodomonas_salina.1
MHLCTVRVRLSGGKGGVWAAGGHRGGWGVSAGQQGVWGGCAGSRRAPRGWGVFAWVEAWWREEQAPGSPNS